MYSLFTLVAETWPPGADTGLATADTATSQKEVKWEGPTFPLSITSGSFLHPFFSSSPSQSLHLSVTLPAVHPSYLLISFSFISSLLCFSALLHCFTSLHSWSWSG